MDISPRGRSKHGRLGSPRHLMPREEAITSSSNSRRPWWPLVVRRHAEMATGVRGHPANMNKLSSSRVGRSTTGKQFPVEAHKSRPTIHPLIKGPVSATRIPFASARGPRGLPTLFQRKRRFGCGLWREKLSDEKTGSESRPPLQYAEDKVSPGCMFPRARSCAADIASCCSLVRQFASSLPMHGSMR